MRRALAWFLVAAALIVARDARADLTSGRDKFWAGDYAGAITDLSKVTGADKNAAKLLVSEAQLALGSYADAETTATALLKEKDAAIVASAKVMLSRIHHDTGKLDEAKKDVEALVKAMPEHYGARYQLALAYQDSGDGKAARVIWKSFMDDFDNQLIDPETASADVLFYLAEAARFKDEPEFQFANDSYRESLHLAPQNVRAAVAWAYLFLQKYASELAAQTIEEVLPHNPTDPDAHAAMAAAVLEGRYDLAAVRHHLDAAFSLNPKNQKALLVRASIEIDRNEWDAARATLDEVLAVNAGSTEALAMKATISWLRDDTKAYEALRAQVFAINDEYAVFYRIVARSAVREHRYKEAVELEKEAVKLQPKYYEAMAGVGEGYLRLGEEKEGLKWLEKAWDGDGYNVRTKNTLDLFDETIPNDYKFVTSKSFKTRYFTAEQKVLTRYIEPVMEKAFADMSKRYGFTPKTPVVLELYADPTDYSVRTVGLPNLGALGVCFGQVITALSPSTGDLNWGMVLVHELGHVFAIQLSNSRVPRWFTEGLSEYETMLARPEWRRENDADLYGAVYEGALPSVSALNYEFMSTDQNAVIVAYYLSSVTIEYIANTYGFDKIVEALKLFGKGKETDEVVETITGRKIAEFDADFRAYLDLRLAPYKGTFRLPNRGYDDVVKLEIAVDAAPQDAARHAALALGYYYGGDADGAQASATAALALDDKNAIARYIMAEIELGMDVGAAAKRYQGMVEDGIDNFDIRVRLAQIAMEGGDTATAEKQLNAAKILDPERSYPYQELASLYQGQGKTDEALRELEQYAYLEQMQLGPAKELVDGYAKKGDWAKVRTFGELAVYINPFDAEVLLQLARAYVELGDGKQALYTYDTALATSPPLRRPALAHIGRARAYKVSGDKAKAKAAIKEALKTEPENREALDLFDELK